MGDPVAGAHRRAAGHSHSRAARHAGARPRHRVHRPRHRAGGGARRDPRRLLRLVADGHRGADRGAERGAPLRDAPHLDRSSLATGAGGDHRRRLRHRLERGDPGAGEESARQREPEGSALRADPLGQSRAPAVRCAVLRRDPRALVRLPRAARPHWFLRAVRLRGHCVRAARRAVPRLHHAGGAGTRHLLLAALAACQGLPHRHTGLRRGAGCFSRHRPALRGDDRLRYSRGGHIHGIRDEAAQDRLVSPDAGRI